MHALRRSFILLAVVALCAAVFGLVPVQGDDPPKPGKKMHGLISKMTVDAAGRPIPIKKIKFVD